MAIFKAFNSASMKRWHTALTQQARSLLDQWATAGEWEYKNPQRLANAYHMLRRGLHGNALKSKLGLAPPPDLDSQKSQKAKKEKTHELVEFKPDNPAGQQLMLCIAPWRITERPRRVAAMRNAGGSGVCASIPSTDSSSGLPSMLRSIQIGCWRSPGWRRSSSNRFRL